MPSNNPSISKILICLDSDPLPSAFDSVVAIDADVDHLLRYGGVTPEAVRDLVYGAMFTRGPKDLSSTALFIGGSDVAAGEALLKTATGCFFGETRVSVMLDSNGANTTAASAVRAAVQQLDLSESTATVLAATGSVGRRVVRMLAREGAQICVASRALERAEAVCDDVRQALPDAKVAPHATGDAASLAAAVAPANLIIAAGAPGVTLLPEKVLSRCRALKVAIDLNAVPPLGIEGVEPADKATEREGRIDYGAIGIGGMKMKLHRAAIRRLFEANDLVLDADEIYDLAKSM